MLDTSPPSGQDYRIQQHQFTISALPERIAHEIAAELQARDIHVLLRGVPTEFLGDEKIGDYTFVIKDQPYYTGSEFHRLINSIRSKGTPRIALQRTAVHQLYTAEGFKAATPLTLSLEIPRGYVAYFKKDKQKVPLENQDGGEIASFSYTKEPGEKYVDVYTLPSYAPVNQSPRTFQRIQLSAPYKTEVLDWHEAWYSAILPEL
jgi:hypothetical protein